MRALGHNPQHILGHDIRDQPAGPRACNRAHNEPAAGLDVREEIRNERAGRIDMLEDLEQRDDIVSLRGCVGQRQLFNAGVDVGQASWLHQQRIPSLVGLGDLQHAGRWVDGCDAVGVWEARGGLGKDAAATQCRGI